MYTLIRTLPTRRLLIEQGPAFLLALTVAELFYKFHSFLLETLGFLVTWFVLDFSIQRLARRTAAGPGSPPTRAE